MIAVNTISKVWYNNKEREKLSAVYFALKEKAERVCEEINEIEDDTEYDSRYHEIDEAFEAAHKAWLRAFAAQFHECKNEWFSGVVRQYEGYDTRMPLSRKQADAFRRYVTDTDDNFWKSNTYYCRCAGFLVSIKIIGTGNYIKVEKL